MPKCLMSHSTANLKLQTTNYVVCTTSILSWAFMPWLAVCCDCLLFDMFAQSSESSPQCLNGDTKLELTVFRLKVLGTLNPIIIMTMPLSLESMNRDNKPEQRAWLKCKRQCVINRYYWKLSQACLGIIIFLSSHVVKWNTRAAGAVYWVNFLKS